MGWVVDLMAGDSEVEGLEVVDLEAAPTRLVNAETRQSQGTLNDSIIKIPCREERYWWAWWWTWWRGAWRWRT